MKRLCFLGLILSLLGADSLGQQVGDFTTGGYTSARTNLNSDFGSAGPPFTLVSVIELIGTTNASSLLAFRSEGSAVLLVGESTEASTDYRLYDRETGTLFWTSSFVRTSGLPLNYTPTVANDVVILGGPSTTGIKAIQVSTGTELWSDDSVGRPSGDPFMTNGLAIYGGTLGFRAVDPMLGPASTFWTIATTTENQAPISSFGEHSYLQTMLPEPAGGGSGSLFFAVANSTGTPLWSVADVLGVDNPNVIATESRVFVNDDDGVVTALDSATGSIVWSRQAGLLSHTSATALAYGCLYLFADSEISPAGLEFGPDSSITALNANTGEPLWRVSEPGEGIDHASIANNVIYYYHAATSRVRARDAFTGALLWSLRRDGVRDLAAVHGSIVLLFADSIEIYRQLQVLYFAHLADGGGQSTLLAISNRTNEEVAATLSFFDEFGDPLSLDVEGFGVTSDVAFSVAEGSSTGIQTLGGETARRGWARIVSDGPLSGSSIFQARDETGLITHEAGVSAAPLQAEGNVYTEVRIDVDDPTRAISSGLAIANPSDEESLIMLILVDSDGSEIETASRLLQPGEQLAQFLGELFPGQQFDDVTGSVQISSDIPFVITSLRTQGGLQLSSYVVQR